MHRNFSLPGYEFLFILKKGTCKHEERDIYNRPYQYQRLKVLAADRKLAAEP